MKPQKGNSLLETRRLNRILIKDTIYKQGTITRLEISRMLELTLPTITTGINEMIAEGILREVPLPEEMLKNTAGRKPGGIELREQYAYAIGAELGPYATYAVLIDLRGNVLAFSEEPPANECYQRMLDDLSRQLKALLKKAQIDRDIENLSEKLLGIGVGLPGFIDTSSGTIRSNPRADWIGHHLDRDLQSRMDLPVLIENNVRIRALGYSMQNKSPFDSFAYLYMSRGLACPIMIKEDVFSGYSSGAGELGHTVLLSPSAYSESASFTFRERTVQKETVQNKAVPKEPIQKDAAQKETTQKELVQERTLDELAGETALILKGQQLIQKEPDSILASLVKDRDRLCASDLLKAQEAGDPSVNSLIRNAIEYIGIALANTVNLINPGFVIVDGRILHQEENRRHLIQATRKRLFGLNENELHIHFLPFDPLRGAGGAGFFVVRKYFLEK